MTHAEHPEAQALFGIAVIGYNAGRLPSSEEPGTGGWGPKKTLPNRYTSQWIGVREP